MFVVATDKRRRAVPLHLQSFLLLFVVIGLHVHSFTVLLQPRIGLLGVAQAGQTYTAGLRGRRPVLIGTPAVTVDFIIKSIDERAPAVQHCAALVLQICCSYCCAPVWLAGGMVRGPVNRLSRKETIRPRPTVIKSINIIQSAIMSIRLLYIQRECNRELRHSGKGRYIGFTYFPSAHLLRSQCCYDDEINKTRPGMEEQYRILSRN